MAGGRNRFSVTFVADCTGVDANALIRTRRFECNYTVTVIMPQRRNHIIDVFVSALYAGIGRITVGGTSRRCNDLFIGML